MRTLMTALFVLVPLLGYAQEPRLTINIAYTLGQFESAFDYPMEKALATGKRYDTEGFAIEASIRLTDVVSIGVRHEQSDLSNATYFEEQGRANETFADANHTSGETHYRELYGSFTIPSSGYSFIVGAARNKLNRLYAEVIDLDSKQTGLVVGGQGRHNLSKATFNYAGRWYPRMNRVESSSFMDEKFASRNGKSKGFELQSSATWLVTEHVGLTGGVHYRRFRTEGPENNFWVVNENESDLKFMVGTRLSF